MASNGSAWMGLEGVERRNKMGMCRVHRKGTVAPFPYGGPCNVFPHRRAEGIPPLGFVVHRNLTVATVRLRWDLEIYIFFLVYSIVC